MSSPEERSYIEFHKGMISFGNYSYEIDSWGYDDLDEEETKSIYLQMKEYYESKSIDK